MLEHDKAPCARSLQAVSPLLLVWLGHKVQAIELPSVDSPWPTVVQQPVAKVVNLLLPGSVLQLQTAAEHMLGAGPCSIPDVRATLGL